MPIASRAARAPHRNHRLNVARSDAPKQPVTSGWYWPRRVSVGFGLLARNLPFAAPQLPELRGRREGPVVAGPSHREIQNRRRKPAIRRYAEARFASAAGRSADGRDEPMGSSSWSPQSSHPTRKSRRNSERITRGRFWPIPGPHDGLLTGSASQGSSLSLSFDHRRSSRLPLTAIASARFWPTSTTNRLPRVMPV